MARSVKRDMMEYDGLSRFRRRRLLAFLRRNNLRATFDAMKHETRAFFDVRFLQRLVVDGRWQQARRYVNRFVPTGDGQILSEEAHDTLAFIIELNVLDDLAHDKLGGEDAADDLEMQIEAIPPTMADPHYTEAVRTVFNGRTHPAYWDPVDWQLIRLKASHIVKDLITWTPEFKHLMRLPRCPIDPRHTIPFGFQGRRRYKRKNIGQIPSSLLAQHFYPKERRSPSPWTQGSSSEENIVPELIDETLQAGKEPREHSDSCEGIPGSLVGSFIGKSCGTSPADGVKKCSSQEQCYAECASSAIHPREAREFYPDAVNGPSVGIDPKLVFNKVSAIGEISGAMGRLLMSTCIGQDHKMFMEKLLEQENLLQELRLHCIKSGISKVCPVGTDLNP